MVGILLSRCFHNISGSNGSWLLGPRKHGRPKYMRDGGTLQFLPVERRMIVGMCCNPHRSLVVFAAGFCIILHFWTWCCPLLVRNMFVSQSPVPETGCPIGTLHNHRNGKLQVIAVGNDSSGSGSIGATTLSMRHGRHLEARERRHPERHGKKHMRTLTPFHLREEQLIH